MSKQLKMVAGKTYMCPPIFGTERTLTRGEVFEVTDEQAERLLPDFYMDSLNNQHFYFAEVGSEAAESEGKVPPKSRRRVAAEKAAA